MDILKIAQDWAKDEVFSTKFFILFGCFFLVATYGFWKLGVTEYAKSFIYPTLIAGILLIIIGGGLLYTNKMRIIQFEKAYNENSTTFVESEMKRVEGTLAEYKSVVFKGIPIIIIIAALIIFFIDKPMWRASAITAITMLIIIMLIDTNAHARIAEYNAKLLDAQEELK